MRRVDGLGRRHPPDPLHHLVREAMGINCGLVIDGEVGSEALGLGDHAFVPWHLGIVS